MKKYYFFFFLILLNTRCDFVDMVAETTAVLDEVAKTDSCKITGSSYTEYDISKLTVYTECIFIDDHKRGQFLLKVFKALRKKGIYYALITQVSKEKETKKNRTVAQLRYRSAFHHTGF